MKTQPTGLGLVTSADDLDTATLTGDVRDLILQEMRDAKSGLPWNDRPEKDQNDAIDRATDFAENIVGRIVRLVAVGDRASVPLLVEKWEVGKGLKLVATAAGSEDNISTLMHGGKGAYLVFANVDDYRGAREEVKAAADQGDLLDADKPVFDQSDAGAGDETLHPALRKLVEPA